MKQLDVIAERDLLNGEPEARPRYLEAETERLLNALNQTKSSSMRCTRRASSSRPTLRASARWNPSAASRAGPGDRAADHGHAPLGIQVTKEAALKYIEAGEAASIAMLPVIRDRVMGTEDAKEGIRSFIERCGRRRRRSRRIRPAP